MGTDYTTSDAEAVDQACASVPEGMVITYGDLAELVGRPTSHSRNVSTILGRRPNAGGDLDPLPWWRVVRSDGTLLDADQITGLVRSGSAGRSTNSPTKALRSLARVCAVAWTCRRPSGCPSPRASRRGNRRRAPSNLARSKRAGGTTPSSTPAASARASRHGGPRGSPRTGTCRTANPSFAPPVPCRFPRRVIHRASPASSEMSVASRRVGLCPSLGNAVQSAPPDAPLATHLGRRHGVDSVTMRHGSSR